MIPLIAMLVYITAIGAITLAAGLLGYPKDPAQAIWVGGTLLGVAIWFWITLLYSALSKAVRKDPQQCQ